MPIHVLSQSHRKLTSAPSLNLTHSLHSHLQWALLELSRKPAIQTKLREELLAFGSADPTLDQLTNQLPYLDAVVHEVLRTHPPVVETNRVVSLSSPSPPLTHPPPPPPRHPSPPPIDHTKVSLHRRRRRTTLSHSPTLSPHEPDKAQTTSSSQRARASRRRLVWSIARRTFGARMRGCLSRRGGLWMARRVKLPEMRGAMV